MLHTFLSCQREGISKLCNCLIILIKGNRGKERVESALHAERVAALRTSLHSKCKKEIRLSITHKRNILQIVSALNISRIHSANHPIILLVSRPPLDRPLDRGKIKVSANRLCRNRSSERKKPSSRSRECKALPSAKRPQYNSGAASEGRGWICYLH